MNNHPYFYTAYGLSIQSPIPLPEFVSGGSAPADVTLRFGRVVLPGNKNGQWRYLCGSDAGVFLFWDDIGAFQVSPDGTQVTIDPALDAESRAIRLAISGPVLGVLLHQRGLDVFHAGAVALDFGAVAFMAHKGFGKSTMVAAMHAYGCPLIADDMVTVEYASGGATVRPGFPQLKLWPESVAVLGESAQDLPELRTNLEKRARRVRQNFAARPLPLQAVFLLEFGDGLSIEPVNPKAAWTGIMPHWYGALAEGELLKVLGLDRQLRACAALARHVPVYTLIRPESLDALPDVVNAVMDFAVTPQIAAPLVSC